MIWRPLRHFLRKPPASPEPLAWSPLAKYLRKPPAGPTPEETPKLAWNPLAKYLRKARPEAVVLPPSLAAALKEHFEADGTLAELTGFYHTAASEKATFPYLVLDMPNESPIRYSDTLEIFQVAINLTVVARPGLAEARRLADLVAKSYRNRCFSYEGGRTFPLQVANRTRSPESGETVGGVRAWRDSIACTIRDARPR